MTAFFKPDLVVGTELSRLAWTRCQWGHGSPSLPASYPGAHGLMENGLSGHAGQTHCQGSLLHISSFFSHWESANLLIEVTLPQLVSDSIELGPGSRQTKKEASGDRLKLWQPGACSYNFKPNFWLMLDVWTWAMQLAPCCLNQLGWMIESWLDLPESRCEVWSDLSRINKNKFAHCLQTQHISVSLC